MNKQINDKWAGCIYKTLNLNHKSSSFLKTQPVRGRSPNTNPRPLNGPYLFIYLKWVQPERLHHKQTKYPGAVWSQQYPPETCETVLARGKCEQLCEAVLILWGHFYCVRPLLRHANSSTVWSWSITTLVQAVIFQQLTQMYSLVQGLWSMHDSSL